MFIEHGTISEGNALQTWTTHRDGQIRMCVGYVCGTYDVYIRIHTYVVLEKPYIYAFAHIRHTVWHTYVPPTSYIRKFKRVQMLFAENPLRLNKRVRNVRPRFPLKKVSLALVSLPLNVVVRQDGNTAAAAAGPTPQAAAAQ